MSYKIIETTAKTHTTRKFWDDVPRIIAATSRDEVWGIMSEWSNGSSGWASHIPGMQNNASSNFKVPGHDVVKAMALYTSPRS